MLQEAALTEVESVKPLLLTYHAIRGKLSELKEEEEGNAEEKRSIDPEEENAPLDDDDALPPSNQAKPPVAHMQLKKKSKALSEEPDEHLEEPPTRAKPPVAHMQLKKKSKALIEVPDQHHRQEPLNEPGWSKCGCGLLSESLKYDWLHWRVRVAYEGHYYQLVYMC